MQDWLCSLGQWWGAIVGAGIILVAIGISILALITFEFLLYKIWEICESWYYRRNFPISTKIKNGFVTIAKILAVIFFCLVILGLLLIPGMELWMNACGVKF